MMKMKFKDLPKDYRFYFEGDRTQPCVKVSAKMYRFAGSKGRKVVKSINAKIETIIIDLSSLVSA